MSEEYAKTISVFKWVTDSINWLHEEADKWKNNAYIMQEERDQYIDEMMKYKNALDVAVEAIDNIDIVFADDVKVIEQAKQEIQQILKGKK